MRYLSYALSTVALIALTAFALITDSQETITVEGNLVDTICYADAVGMDMPEAAYNDNHMVPGPDGEMMEVPNCATQCANMGIPVGVNEGDEPGGNTYVLITPADQLADFMDHTVRVEGKPAFDGGIKPDKIEALVDGEWQEVEIQLMM